MEKLIRTNEKSGLTTKKFAKAMAKEYREYLEMVYAVPGKYRRHETYGKNPDGTHWFEVNWFKIEA